MYLFIRQFTTAVPLIADVELFFQRFCSSVCTEVRLRSQVLEQNVFLSLELVSEVKVICRILKKAYVPSEDFEIIIHAFKTCR